MTLVVVGHGARASLLHRQPRLGAVQRLNLASLRRVSSQIPFAQKDSTAISRVIAAPQLTTAVDGEVGRHAPRFIL
jgi:hypothetical protein